MKMLIALMMLLLTLCSSDHPIIEIEEEALNTFYLHLDGYFWRSNNWRSTRLYCNWDGITCDNDGHVFSIGLEGYGLRGDMPPQIGDLSYLVMLDLDDNEITSLPAEIGRLEKLEVLFLALSDLKEIPAEIGMLKNLVTLDLSTNHLTEIRREIFNLTSLKDFNIDDNEIRTLPKEIGNLMGLEHFDVSACGISVLPEEIGLLKNMMDFRAAHNTIVDIPASLFEIPGLTTILLSDNLITKIPDEIGIAVNLHDFYIENNMIEEIPETIGNAISLRNLVFNNNAIKKIPASIGRLVSLVSLRVSKNSISKIPKELGELTSLRSFGAEQNQITELPAEIGNISGLKFLNVPHNLIEKLPIELSKLTLLSAVALEFNRLTEFPMILCDIPNIEFLRLSNNQIRSIPDGINSIVNLRELQIRNNIIFNVPDLLHLPRLTTLRMNNNSLTNFSFLRNLTTLESLYLDENSVNDITGVFTNMPSLRILSLQYLWLSEIPIELSQLSSLQELYLDHNIITFVPRNLMDIRGLQVLSLRGNLIDRIDPFMWEIGPLRRIDLANNLIRFFTGVINDVDIDISYNNLLRLISIRGRGNIQATHIVNERFRTEMITDAFEGMINITNSGLRIRRLSTRNFFLYKEGVQCSELFIDDQTNIIGFPIGFAPDFCYCKDGYVGSDYQHCILCETSFGSEYRCSNTSITFKSNEWPVVNATEFIGFESCSNGPSICNVNRNCTFDMSTLTMDCNICREGHEGRLCSQCLEHHWRNLVDGFCYPCTLFEDLNILIIVLISSTALLIIILGFILTRTCMKNIVEFLKVDITQNDLGIILSLIFYSQTVTMKIPLSLYELQIFPAVNSSQIIIENSTNIFSETLDLLLSPLDCARGLILDTEWEFFLFDMLYPVLICSVLGLLGLTMLLYSSIKNKCRKDLDDTLYFAFPKKKNKKAHFFLFLTFRIFDFFWFGFMTRILEIFMCTESIDTNKYLVIFPWIKCDVNDNEYFWLFTLSILFSFLYIVPYLLFLLGSFCILRKKNRESGGANYFFAFLYDHHKNKFYWFELIWISRRLLLSVIITFVPLDIQQSCVLTVLIACLILHVSIFPLKSLEENIIESISLILLACCYNFLSLHDTLGVAYYIIVNLASIFFVGGSMIVWIVKKYRRYKDSDSEIDELMTITGSEW